MTSCKKIKFLIDNILQPEFGKSAQEEVPNQPKVQEKNEEKPFPAWIYCTRYSDRPSCTGQRRRKKIQKVKTKRPRTSFNSKQLAILCQEFTENPYLNEDRRKNLAQKLGLDEAQIKIWFQNKRAKVKKKSKTSKTVSKDSVTS